MKKIHYFQFWFNLWFKNLQSLFLLSCYLFLRGKFSFDVPSDPFPRQKKNGRRKELFDFTSVFFIIFFFTSSEKWFPHLHSMDCMITLKEHLKEIIYWLKWTTFIPLAQSTPKNARWLKQFIFCALFISWLWSSIFWFWKRKLRWMGILICIYS